MSAAVQVSEPFSEIEREIRKLESLLTQKAMEAEILHETLDILRADPMSQNLLRSGPRPARHDDHS